MIAYPPTPPRWLRVRGSLLHGALAAAAVTAGAAPFVYQPSDLLLTLRQPGAAADLIVNLGKASVFSTLAEGASVTLTNLSRELLATTFATPNGLRWSVAGANRPPVDAAFPIQSLWVTAPRIDPEVQAPAWLRKGQFVQGNAASQIDGIGYNAAQASSLLPGGPANSVSAVAVPLDNAFAVDPLLGETGNYVGAFQGTVEDVTPDDFDAGAAQVSRSDLYELLPGTSAAGTLNQPGRRLGFFELRADGTLIFSTSAPALAAPVVTKIERAGDVTTVTFTTVAGATYQLRSTGAAGLGSAASAWETGPSVAGNGSAQSLQFTSTEAVRFFVIEARR